MEHPLRTAVTRTRRVLDPEELILRRIGDCAVPVLAEVVSELYAIDVDVPSRGTISGATRPRWGNPLVGAPPDEVRKCRRYDLRGVDDSPAGQGGGREHIRFTLHPLTAVSSRRLLRPLHCCRSMPQEVVWQARVTQGRHSIPRMPRNLVSALSAPQFRSQQRHLKRHRIPSIERRV